MVHLLLTPVYPQSQSPSTLSPVSFGPSILTKLYATMREEAIARAEEVSNLMTPPPESPSSALGRGFGGEGGGSRPTTALPNAARIPVKVAVKPTINGIPLPDLKDSFTEPLYPPVQLLSSVVGRLWKEKEALPTISFDSGHGLFSPFLTSLSPQTPLFKGVLGFSLYIPSLLSLYRL